MRFSLLLLMTICVCLQDSRGNALGAEEPRADTPQLGAIAHVSKRVLEDMLNRDVTLKETVSEPILNMTTLGTARIDCKVGLDLLPNPQAANLRLSMNGTVIMDDAVSTAGSVRIHSTSQTQIRVDKDVLLDAQGLHLLPARSSARASIRVHNIDSRGRFVEGVAWRRVGRTQSEAEEACGQRTARRAEQQLELEVGKSLGKVQSQYVDNVLKPLSDRGAFPDARLATTRDHLSIRLFRNAERAAMSPLSGPPPRLADDLAICLNDSFVNEMAALVLAGKTYTDHELADLLKILIGATPRPLWIHARTAPWSVTAAQERPVVVSFAGDRVSITLRIDHAVRGGEHLDRTLAVTAVYALECTADGPRLIRSGDLAVEFTDADPGDHADPRDAQFLEFLQRKFAGVFLADLYFDGLMPPEGGLWGKLRRLQLTEFSSRDGWLNMGYELQSVAPVVSAPRSTRAR
jgi:hypothetical protein